MAAAGVPPWHLRYRAAIADAYKWECVGAVPWTSVFSGSFDVSSAVYTTVNDTQITLPLAGYYTARFSTVGSNNSNGQGTVANVKVGATAESGDNELSTQNPSGVNTIIFPGSRRTDPLLAAAGDVAAVRWKTTAGGGTARLYRADLEILPVRVI
jgi:hypothetical protein